MPIQQATDYGIRAVLHLALKPGQLVEAQEIACEERIPLQFLQKILRLLGSAGLIETKRGNAGGCRLRRDPAEITLLDVVAAVEGTHKLTRCLDDPDHCSKGWADRCPVHRRLGAIQEYLEKELGACTFADLVAEVRTHQDEADLEGSVRQ
ncbi:MAG: RrF2 family transcriptional regulator [Chitinophagales bacterium]